MQILDHRFADRLPVSGRCLRGRSRARAAADSRASTGGHRNSRADAHAHGYSRTDTDAHSNTRTHADAHGHS